MKFGDSGRTIMANVTNMKILVKISHWICLFPLNMDTSKNKPVFKLGKKYYFARVVLLDSIIVACIVKNCYDTLESNMSLKNMVFVFCSFPLVIAILEVQIVGFLNRTKYAKLIMTLSSIEVNLNKRTDDPGNYTILVQLILIFCSFLYLFIVYFVCYEVDEAVVLTFGYTLSKFMIFISSCICISFLKIIRDNFRKLSELLLSSDHLVSIFYIYLDLVFVCKKINKLFGRQLLLTILIYFIWTIYEIYHLVILWPCDSCPRFLIALALSHTIIQESLLFAILWSCQSTQRESNRFKAVWYSKLSRKMCKFNQNRIDKCSLKLIHHNVVFTAMGLYVLDLKQFFSVVSKHVENIFFKLIFLDVGVFGHFDGDLDSVQYDGVKMRMDSLVSLLLLLQLGTI